MIQPINHRELNEYRPGEDNPSDYLSRHPDLTTEQSRREEKVAEEYINYVFTNAVPKAIDSRRNYDCHQRRHNPSSSDSHVEHGTVTQSKIIRCHRYGYLRRLSSG